MCKDVKDPKGLKVPHNCSQDSTDIKELNSRGKYQTVNAKDRKYKQDEMVPTVQVVDKTLP